jgi:hypothetical protein
MSVIPDEIAEDENISHALFYPGDATKEPFWIKHKALVPPNSSPTEVSCNRACYVPDSFQKRLAKAVKRKGKTFVGFLVLTQKQLKEALSIMDTSYEEQHGYGFPFAVEFRYTPIFERNSNQRWPSDVPKKHGNGYNPAHSDLCFGEPVIKGEPNTHHNGLAKIISAERHNLCKVYREIDPSVNNEEWKGPELC